MRRVVFSLLLCTMVMMAGSVLAQDAGAPDSVYIQFGHTPDLNSADRSLVVEFYLKTDTNVLTGISAGFGWDNPKLHLDSTVAINHAWDFLILCDYNSIDSANAKQTFLYAGMAISENHFLYPTGVPLKLANYYFTLNDWDAADTVVFDSTSWDAGSEFAIAPFEAEVYVPDFAGAIMFSGDVPNERHIWFVSPGGSDDTGDGSRDNPFATIQHGVNATELTDTLVLMDGTYTGPGNYGVEIIQKYIYITSENGPEVTIINPEQQGFAFYIWDGMFGADGMLGPVIEGLTFTNGQGTGGGAIRCFGASPLIQRCLFLYNHASHGGAIYFNGNDFAATASPDSIPYASVIGCTFVGNQAISGSAIYYQYNGIEVHVERCLFVGNTADYGAPVDVDTNFVGGATAVLSCTDVFSNMPGDWTGSIMGQENHRGNISADPQFCEAYDVDFHIHSTSPCAPANNTCGSLIGALGVRCSGGGEARSWWVSEEGEDSPENGDQNNPLRTIMYAINKSSDFDTVQVMPGYYREEVNFDGKTIVVRSTEGPGATIITSDSAVTLVTFENNETSQSVLEGFRLQGGWIGIHCMDAAPTIRHNVLVGQQVTNWAALVLSGKGSWTGHSPATIVNNTIVNSGNGGISTFSLEAPTIKNNIIAYNAHYGIHREGIMEGVAQPLLSYNDVFGNPVDYQEIEDPGVGTISADPMFYSRGFDLSESSPCINAGDPDPIYNDPNGSRNDMGAIPFGGGVGPVVIPTNEWINIYCGSPYFEDQQLVRNEIRAYDPDGVLCGLGWIQRDGSFGFMPIYRDDIYTDFDEGAEPGDKISFTIDGVPVTSDPVVIWTENGDSYEVCHFATEQCLTLELHAGWNLVSYNVAYEGIIRDAVADFADCIDVILSFQQGGLTYDPKLPEFSTLWKFNFYHGYWFKMNCDATLEFCGPDIPAHQLIGVQAGWNLVSYWPDTTLPVEYALESIIPGVEVVAGYDNGVKTWMPDMDQYNSLSALEPGFGYWVKSSYNAFLLYPGWGYIIDFKNGSVVLLSDDDNSAAPVGSRDWMSVYGKDITLDGNPLQAGDLIEFFSADGVRCGKSVYGDDLLKFSPVYGQDAADEFTKAYAADGESVSITVNGARVYPDIVWEGGGSRVALGELTTNKNGLVPASYALAQNYPNPFNPSTIIQYDLPNAGHVRLAIYNVLGQQVRSLVDAPCSAGQFEITWDGRDQAGQTVSSGIYLYRLETDGFSATRKMVLMK